MHLYGQKCPKIPQIHGAVCCFQPLRCMFPHCWLLIIAPRTTLLYNKHSKIDFATLLVVMVPRIGSALPLLIFQNRSITCYTFHHDGTKKGSPWAPPSGLIHSAENSGQCHGFQIGGALCLPRQFFLKLYRLCIFLLVCFPVLPDNLVYEVAGISPG